MADPATSPARTGGVVDEQPAPPPLSTDVSKPSILTSASDDADDELRLAAVKNMDVGDEVPHGFVSFFKSLRKGDWFCLLCCLCMSIANIFQGYDTGIISSITSDPKFVSYFNMTAAETGAFAAIINVGNVIANLGITAYVSGTWGRRPGFIIASAVLSLGVILQVASVNVAMLLLGRIIAGIGCGLAGCTLAVYLAEITPTRWRGGAVSMIQLAYNLGVVIAYWVALGTQKLNGNLSWRIGNVLQLLFGTLLVLFAIILPESPRHLLSRSQHPASPTDPRACDALRNLSRLRCLPPDHPELRSEFDELTKAYQFRKDAKMEKVAWGAFIRSKSVWKRLGYGMGTMALGQVSGVGALMIYGVTIFEQFLSGRSLSLITQGVSGILSFLSVLVSIFLVDRFGRRKLLLSGSGVQVVCYLLIAALLAKWPAGENKGAAAVVIICILLIQMAYSASTGPVAWVYASEIWPQELRDRGVNLAQFGQQAVLIALNQAWPVMVANMKEKAYWVLFSINITAWTVVFFLWPETSGRKLEEIDAIFGEIDVLSAARRAHDESCQVEGEKKDKDEGEGEEKEKAALKRGADVEHHERLSTDYT